MKQVLNTVELIIQTRLSKGFPNRDLRRRHYEN